MFQALKGKNMDYKNITIEELPVILTISEIGQILKVDTKTVLDLIETQKIQTIKGIEKPRITSLSLLNFLGSNGEGQTSQQQEMTEAEATGPIIGLIKD
tara:strand:+ start:644 stop:940 length:297 start_codon:yes stop_codon:yes gene_type:complete